MSIIEAHTIVRSYGKGSARFTAVDGVSFQVERGELVALLGTNGAGKTSLTEILQGTASATSGEVRLFGHDPQKERAAVRPRTGIMLQEAGFADDLSVAETLTMWRGTMAQGRSVADAMDLVNLSHRATVRVKALSGGERRRLDLAMATLGRPELLFLDEPTTGLDPASRRATWELISSMLNEGTTVFLTTHYLEEAEALADRVMVMAAGRILTEGSVAQIVASQPSTISFVVPEAQAGALRIDEAVLATLPALSGAVARERQRFVLHSSDLQTTLGALLALADSHGVRLEALDARSASLEQAFLALTTQSTGTEAGVSSLDNPAFLATASR
ncbi:ABC transporter ATP-binding protein [Schaalia canis]|uniref:ABC transporter ATP-binding protein n=1 Tax=Schaalia canis TaxID=100469 RepID=A0A3P1SCG3_9ACTO|nr:ABC transporter ATP-binding protein [Schaalia canis]RRC94963.1 ABC transporter ATP-binding protein [Schaalia canis]